MLRRGISVFFLFIFHSSCTSLLLLETAETTPKGKNRFFLHGFMSHAYFAAWDENPPLDPRERAKWEPFGGVQFGWRRGISGNAEFHIKGGYSYPFTGLIGGGMKFSASRNFAIGFGTELGYPVVAFYAYPIISIAG